MSSNNNNTVEVPKNILTLTNSQMVAARKLASVAKRGAAKGQDAQGFAVAALNQLLLTRYEILHKALGVLESARYDSALEMGAQFPEGMTKSVYLAKQMQESADILLDLQAGGSR